MSAKILAVVAVLAVSACTTTGGRTSHKDPTLADDQQPKAGQKDEQAAATPPATPEAVPAPPPETPTIGPVVQAPPQPSDNEQLVFVKKQTNPSTPFTEPDRQFVKQLAKAPAPGTVQEAALSIGLVRLALNPDAVAPAIQEGDAHKQTLPPTLEQLCKDQGLNLPDALTENPLLNGFGVAKQVHEALALGANSPEFKLEVTAALKKQASLWQEFSSSLNAPGDPAAAATPAPPPEDLSPPNPAELAGGDAVLGEAQALADRGNYQAAIKKASSVPESSPMRPMAQEKVKEFSNLAVQDLRKKAASAFQSAMPVTDVKTRAGYLKQAKGFLEEAIKNYPDATQLPTVRDNLRVISRDLEKLEAEQGATTG